MQNNDNSGLMSIYNAKNVSIIVDGISLFGFQSGDMVGWTQAEDNVNLVIDAQGTGTGSESNDKHGTVTIHLSQASPKMKDLNDLLAASKYFSFTAKSDNEMIESKHSWVTKAPDGSFSNTLTARDWGLTCVNLGYSVI
ncbi:MAG: hypothetical protein DUD35_05370 [Lactobacillus sp.]|nr:MAG: hypothetical protein DUD35_05370 [Lactobacillus sp.]